jgi:hypothetical protein
MGWGVAPVQPPVLGRHVGPLLFENLQESGQSSPDVGVVNGLALGDIVCVDNALGIKEDKDYLLREMRSRALIGPGCPFFIHRLDCRGVEGYGGLIHGDNIVRDCQQPPTKGPEGSRWCSDESLMVKMGMYNTLAMCEKVRPYPEEV